MQRLRGDVFNVHPFSGARLGEGFLGDLREVAQALQSHALAVRYLDRNLSPAT